MGQHAATTELRRVVLPAPDDFEAWRAAARGLAAGGIPPSNILWSVAGDQPDLLGGEKDAPALGLPVSVPREFLELAEKVVCHCDPERFALLYQMLWKLRSNRQAFDDGMDPQRVRLDALARGVDRDAHKMHAFVRFREIGEPNGTTRFVAWFEPAHYILRREAGFFVRRFSNIRWSILTPRQSIHWDGQALMEGPGAARCDAPAGDPLEETWKTYFAAAFNPARLKVGAMTREMPKKYWKNLPESALIAPLIATARSRELAMLAQGGGVAPAATTVPTQGTGHLQGAWAALRDEVRRCARCRLGRCATRAVFGEGPLDARLFLVGEQPGDQEDLAGRPFVGPAGKLLDDALQRAGIDRSRAYITNAVKHFKFLQRGKKRLHARPDASEIDACRWWLERERSLVRPTLTVALGATAARALTGHAVAIGSIRGQPLKLADGSECWVTVHPSYLLRIPDDMRRQKEHVGFIEDLKRIRERADALAH